MFMAQCPSCKFENMPQHATCVRCGSILPGSNFPIEIEPPRAGKLEKKLRMAVAIRTINRFISGTAASLLWTRQTLSSFFMLQIRSLDFTILGMFWKGILPGMAQWYSGRKPHDSFFFFGWLILLLGGLLTFGLSFSPCLFGLVIAWHLFSIIDIACITSIRRSDRLFMFVTMTLTAFFVFYVPTSGIWWGRVNVGRVHLDGAGSIRRGDSLIYFNVRSPVKLRLGGMVLYNAPHLSYSMPGPGETVYQFGGDMYGRVLAAEGQKVSWKKGVLTVDDAPPVCQPFVPVVGPPDVEFEVPAGYCYIVPGTMFVPHGAMRQPMAVPREAEQWKTMGLVPNGSIYGVVWAVRRSLFHFVDIRSDG